ncbi:hypothetical protein V7094_28360 [Priestia megaterium]|uniref:hypothetical protein n=1 Tax=Priestia megaterium TaxID=1404 RepID=UPI002FFEEB9D
MSKKDEATKSYGMTLLKKAEAKRVGENLTKRELTNTFNIHYNYYWNCINDKNTPSESLIASLEAYLRTPTLEVYETIFALRREEEGNKKIEWDTNGREVPSSKLGYEEGEVDEILAVLERDGVYKEPELHNKR